MWKLVPALEREMGQAFPELVRASNLITETLRLEEQRFRKTLERGLRMLDDESSGLCEGDKFSGETAFKLYDTYGFPLDLTEDALKSRGIAVDTDAFNTAMERQRAEARKAWAGSGEAATDTHWFDIREKAGATDFLGYETERAEGEIVALLARDGHALVDSLQPGDEAAIIANQSPFYGESGGQVGDRGEIRTGVGAVFTVTDTQKKLGDLLVHYGRMDKGTLRPGDAIELSVERTRRAGARVHHSATHLVHEALRQVLGGHVVQKGSLVEPDRLRFDFSHPKALDPAEIERVEDLSNQVVLQNDPVTTRLMNVDDAIAEGAMALFGEKYGDEVRVVSMGLQPQDEGNKPIYSLELCGGTHVARTGDIGVIKIVAETASAAGVRRVEALAGEAARKYLNEQDRRLGAAAMAIKASPADVPARLESLMDDRRRLERELAEAKRQLALGGGAGSADDGEAEIAGVKVVMRALHGINPKDLRGLVDDGKKKLGSGVVAVVGVNEEGKAGVAVGVTDDLTDKFNAVDLVRAGSQALGGKGGGGRADMAQAGGPDGSKADAALDAIRDAISAAA